jgi:hypothetical protein
MTTAVPKLAGFAGALGLVFGGSALAGGLINPSPPGAAGASKAMNTMNEMAATSIGVRGLGVAENGLRLVVARPNFTRARVQQLRFHIVDKQGAAVRKFDVEHTKPMHLIVVRRDMTGFRHLHPVEDARGNWTTPLRLDAPGSYRVFADFSHRAKPTTLAADLTVDGPFASRGLPRPQRIASAGGGYAVRLDAAKPTAGKEADLRFTVTRRSLPVAVEQYLGADGHLVALRDGDLAFLHVHPTGARGTAGDHVITFGANFPTTGRYGLFLQFKVDGRVHTAAFTQDVS